jgi:DNA transformation protein
LVLEQMADFGFVTARRMFGGAGIYRDGMMFALIADDVLYL